MSVVLFDLDDTLLDYSSRQDACWSECCTRVAAPAGVDPEALISALREVRRWFWDDAERHRCARTDMLGAWTKIVELALERVGRGADGLPRRMAEDFAARRVAAERLFPEARVVLERLRAGGVPLGLVTNGDARLQRDKIGRHALAGFFDVIVIEGEFGCGKPDVRVFRHALAALGSDAARAWMVGDHLVWDVAGAQSAGARAVWIDRARRGVPADSATRPDRIIHSLDEL